MKIEEIHIPPFFVKRWKRWERRLTLSKRQQFVVITLFLTLLLVLTQLISIEYIRYPLVVILALVTYIASAFGLREDLQGIEWFTLLVPVTLYSAAVALFYFLLPERWLTRIPVLVCYAVGLYALLLTENIYNVAANRTIALLRAARSVGFLITLVSFYLLIMTTLSFRSYPWATSIVFMMLTFLHAFPMLWSVELSHYAEGRVVALTLALTLVVGELSWIILFWPMPTSMVALLVSAVFYAVVGMGQEYLADKLYKKTITEFLFVCIFVFFAAFLTTRWRGI